MPKSTNILIEQRVQDISEKLLDGWSRSEIFRYAADWGISTRQLDHYIRKGRELYESEVEEHRERVFKKHISRRERLFRKAYDSGNFKLAASILNDLAKIDGSIVEKRQIEVSGNLSNHTISDDELDKLIQKEINQGKDGAPQ